MIGDLLNTLATAQKLDIAQLQKSIQAGSLPAYIGIPLLQQKMADRQKATAALSGQGQQNQPPIGDQVMAQAQQVAQPGIDHLASNLPEEGYANGGIIAFNGETDSLVPEDDGDYEDDDIDTNTAVKVGLATAGAGVGFQGIGAISDYRKAMRRKAMRDPWDRLSKIGQKTLAEQQSPWTKFTPQAAAQASKIGPAIGRTLGAVGKIGVPLAGAGAVYQATDYLGSTPAETAAKLLTKGREVIGGVKALPEQTSDVLGSIRQWAQEHDVRPRAPWEFGTKSSEEATVPQTPPAEAQPSAQTPAQAFGPPKPPTLAPNEISSHFAKEPTVSTSHAGIMAAPGASKASAEPEGIAQLAKPADDLFGKEIEANRSERENLRKMITGDTAKDEEEFRKNMWMALAQGGFKAMAGTSPWAMTNLGAGLEEGVKGIAAAKTAHEEAQRKKVEQIATLGLKGQELDNTLRQYGITREYYNAHLPLLAAQTKATLAGIETDRAKLAIAGARAAGGGGGGVGGIKGLTQGAKLATMLDKLSTPTDRDYARIDALRENIVAKPDIYMPKLLKDGANKAEKLRSWFTSAEEKDAIKAELADMADRVAVAEEEKTRANRMGRYKAFLE